MQPGHDGREPLDFSPVYAVDGTRGSQYAAAIPELLRAGAPRELDDDAMALFLRLGFFVGGDTPFRAIRAALPPPPDAPAPNTLTRPQLADALLDLFRAAIRRRLPSAAYVHCR